MPPASQSYTPPAPPRASASSMPATGTPPPNYLVQSILVTLCCCLPLGIVAIVFSAQVNSKFAAGDFAGAADSSAKAKMFCWIGLGLGLALQAIWLFTGGLAMIQGFREGMGR
jgi:hypothetical protein